MSSRPRLYISHDPAANRLSALEFGRVDDGQPLDRWEEVVEDVGLLHDAPGGRCVGFLLIDLAAYDPDDPANATLWDGPRFDVPALGLEDVPPNAIVVATRRLYGARPSLNRALFVHAIEASGHEALDRWLACLQAGDSMAHQALGYTLFALGRIPEAYRHLRHYCELAPAEPWAWCWYGKAAAALGELDEARRAYATAIDLEDEEDGEETDAAELLERLEAGDVEVPPLVPAPPPELAEEDEDLALDALLIGSGLMGRRSPGDVLTGVLTPGGPAAVHRLPDGMLEVIARIGTLEEEDEDEVRAQLADLGERDAHVHGENAWLVVELGAGTDGLTPARLRIALTGVALEAQRIRHDYEDVYGADGLLDIEDDEDDEDEDLDLDEVA